MKESEEEGEEDGKEEDIMNMTREKEREAKRPVRTINIVHVLAGSSEKAEEKEGVRQKNRYQERRGRRKDIITRRL